MKHFILFLIIAVLAYGYIQNQGLSLPAPDIANGNNQAVQEAYSQGRSDVQLTAKGVVDRLLRDDLDGSRHQKFVLRLDSGLTILVSHNIDLAPRVNSLSQGDAIEVFGEYEWNSKGGVIHWTHHDPNGRHVAGWIKHDGITYQ
jgi:hypothetical protein